MSLKRMIPWVAAVAAGVVAYGVARNAVCDRSDVSLDRLQDVSFLARELELNDAQVREIKRLHTTLGVKLNDCCRRHCAARARLGNMLSTETNETDRTREIVGQMCRAYEESELATLDHMQQVRALLKPEQKRRFGALIGRCLCKSREMINCAASTRVGMDSCEVRKEDPE